jgi:hypothetical protein
LHWLDHAGAELFVMAGQRIQIKGFAIDKHGKLVRRTCIFTPLAHQKADLKQF